MEITKKVRRTQAERRDEAEGKLVRSAIRLLAQKGYSGFTLADVGDAAGYSRGLAAHYFGKKEDLLNRVAMAIAGDYRKILAAIPAETPGLPRILKSIEHYTRTSGEIQRRAIMLLITEAAIEPELRGMVEKLNSAGVQYFENELRQGIELGNVSPDINIERLAQVIHSYIRGSIHSALTDSNFDAQGSADVFLDMIETYVAMK